MKEIKKTHFSGNLCERRAETKASLSGWRSWRRGAIIITPPLLHDLHPNIAFFLRAHFTKLSQDVAFLHVLHVEGS
jgi:hypothetical protein